MFERRGEGRSSARHGNRRSKFSVIRESSIYIYAYTRSLVCIHVHIGVGQGRKGKVDATHCFLRFFLVHSVVFGVGVIMSDEVRNQRGSSPPSFLSLFAFPVLFSLETEERERVQKGHRGQRTFVPAVPPLHTQGRHELCLGRSSSRLRVFVLDAP